MSDATVIEFVKLAAVVLGVLVILLTDDAGVGYWRSLQRAKRWKKDQTLFRDQQPHASPVTPVSSLSTRAPKGFTPINGYQIKDRRAHVTQLRKKAN